MNAKNAKIGDAVYRAYSPAACGKVIDTRVIDRNYFPDEIRVKLLKKGNEETIWERAANWRMMSELLADHEQKSVNLKKRIKEIEKL